MKKTKLMPGSPADISLDDAKILTGYARESMRRSFNDADKYSRMADAFKDKDGYIRTIDHNKIVLYQLTHMDEKETQPFLIPYQAGEEDYYNNIAAAEDMIDHIKIYGCRIRDTEKNVFRTSSCLRLKTYHKIGEALFNGIDQAANAHNENITAEKRAQWKETNSHLVGEHLELRRNYDYLAMRAVIIEKSQNFSSSAMDGFEDGVYDAVTEHEDAKRLRFRSPFFV